MTCINMEAVLAACVAGVGIAWMPDFLAARALATGELARVLDQEVGTQGAFWLVWVAGRPIPPKLRAFADFAARRLFDRSERPAQADAVDSRRAKNRISRSDCHRRRAGMYIP